MQIRSLLAVVVLGCACTAVPPPRWQEGGARLELAEARWQRSEIVVEITPDGRVFEDGHHTYSIDGVGRVVDDSGRPVAILLPSGRVRGPDDRDLGRVDAVDASPPGLETAWLTIDAEGNLTRFKADGEARSAGRWFGCTGAVVRTCVFVSHLRAVEHLAQQSGQSSHFTLGL